MIHIEDNRILFPQELSVQTISVVYEQIQEVWEQEKAAQWLFDFTATSHMDSAGVALIETLQEDAIRREMQIEFIHWTPHLERTRSIFSSSQLPDVQKPQAIGFWEKLGEEFLNVKNDVFQFILLMADSFYWGIVGLFSAKGRRKGTFIQQAVAIGVEAVPIVAMLSLVLGVILTLQSANQLRQFGADIFVADLLAFAMVNEMGPMMTAVIVAGRSGSAIASEIATMCVTEEVDALKMMALNPIRFVMIPKVYAMLFTLPLLVIISDIVGFLGGLLVSISFLDLSPIAFINELFRMLRLKDLIISLGKTCVFAFLIVNVGCFYGFRARGSAEAVGRATTLSVVASIALIIIADAINSLLFYF